MVSESDRIRVEVVHATPHRQVVLALDLPADSTLREAIKQSGIQDVFPGLVVEAGAVGIFGRREPFEKVLSDGDRVEIYRPLLADPKEARRKRAETARER